MELNKMKKLSKRIYVVAFSLLALVGVAGAQLSWYRDGTLGPNRSVKYQVRVGPGDYDIAALGMGLGDLDMRVYDSNGALVDQDTEPDNEPVCSIHVPSRRTITIKLTNADEDFSVDYAAGIE